MIELFAGTGRLCAACKAIGLKDSIGVDHRVQKHTRSPMLCLDLQLDSSWELIYQLVNSGTIFWVHAAPPCGTASRARLIQRKGQNNPPVVRTDEHPDGLPNLTCSLRDRVKSANILYLRTAELFEHTWNLGVYMSVENPGRSFMWDATFWKQRLQQFPVFETLFHHCCHGGHRRKLTKQWTTAEETAYPSKLCQTWAALALVAATDLHVATPAGSLDDFTRTDHRAARASLGMQAAVQKIPPLVREFKDVVTLQGPADLMPASKLQATWTIPHAIRCDKDYSMLPAGSRVIRTQFQGVCNICRGGQCRCGGNRYWTGKIHHRRSLDASRVFV